MRHFKKVEFILITNDEKSKKLAEVLVESWSCGACCFDSVIFTIFINWDDNAPQDNVLLSIYVTDPPTLVMGLVHFGDVFQLIMLYTPPWTHRRRSSSFYVPLCRTTQFQTAPLYLAQKLYNEIVEIDVNVDIYFDSRATFKAKIVR